MDQRRFRSLCAAGIFLLALVVNGRLLMAAFSGEFSVDYVLGRYSAALVVGFMGMRIMDSILFRPRHPGPAAGSASSSTSSSTSPSSTVASATGSSAGEKEAVPEMLEGS